MEILPSARPHLAARRLRRASAWAAAGLLLAGGAGAKDPPALKSTDAPDLVIQSQSILKSVCEDGVWTVTVKATVKNVSAKGTADLTQHPWRIVLGFAPSTIGEPIVSTVQPRLAGPEKLAPGASWTGTATLKIGGESAAMTAEADPDHAIVEFSEANNTRKTELGKNPCLTRRGG